MSERQDIQAVKALAAEVMETAARLLRNGDNPYRVAAHLDACARVLTKSARPTDDPRYERGAH